MKKTFFLLIAVMLLPFFNMAQMVPAPEPNRVLMLYSGFGTHTIKKDYRVLLKIDGEPGYYRTRVKKITQDSVFFRKVGHVPLDKIKEIGYFSKKDKWIRYSSLALYGVTGLCVYQYLLGDKSWIIPAAVTFAIPTFFVLSKRKTYRIPKPWSIDISSEKTINGEVFFR